MKNTKKHVLLNSLIVLPMLTGAQLGTGAGMVESLSFRAENTSIEQILLTEEEIAKEEAIIEAGKKIDAFYESHNLPLAGYGEKLAREASNNGLPLTLLASIAFNESTAYKHACKRDPENGFGWASCKSNFTSIDHAIETVAYNLGGNNPNTARYYAGKNLDQIIDAYNPPSIAPKYKTKIKSVMASIDQVTVPDTATSVSPELALAFTKHLSI